MTLNKKNQKRVAKVRKLVAAGRVREACDFYHEEAVDHSWWRSRNLRDLSRARKRNPKARMHPSTRRNINDDCRALRVMMRIVDPENTFAHADDFMLIAR